ncbi:hypothetical protein CcCBS67573_g03000 [Chytriomyces confervae]|uniref:Phospholipid-transporting ATPase n=1 Tax=Chytriomyces confervae TaxID=246404 RepID=A0A507FH45_9FUNG|nr:hypothetical protein CcCBS67573_g03000 [Chytriomyces confervae]
MSDTKLVGRRFYVNYGARTNANGRSERGLPQSGAGESTGVGGSTGAGGGAQQFDQPKRGSFFSIFSRSAKPARGSPFVDNTVRTARFTVVSFLPMQLLIQFSKVANVYFLLISALQLIPTVSPTGQFTTILPLSFFVVVSMVKEGYDDYFRHKQDAAENNSPVYRLHVSKDGNPANSSWEKISCKNVHVGDIIRIKDREFVPVDLIVLSSSNTGGVCFVETSNLDGETNLKQRQALKCTSDSIHDISSLASYHAMIHTESPSGDLYNFDGYLQEPGASKTPLTPIQLLQRGATLRNTHEIYGIAVYTGEESKIRMNSYTPPSAKMPHLQHVTNKVIILILVGLLLLSAVGSLAYILWDRGERLQSNGEPRHWYLTVQSNYSLLFFTFVVLFNAFIPIALYVSMEVVKVVQVYFMMNDLDMYDAERDIPCQANTSSLNEELGQVQYVFSDKTGTLTENVMEFRLFSVAGSSVRHPSCPPREDDSIDGSKVMQSVATGMARGALTEDHQQIHEFMLSMALCHAVVPDLSQSTDLSTPNSSNSSKQIIYQSASADEVAIVNAARDLQYVYKERRPSSIILNILNQPSDAEYSLLTLIDFTSDRKRMSTVYRYPDGRIMLLTKGADNVILERLCQDSLLTPSQLSAKKKTLLDITGYANEGLRTLLYGYRILNEQEYASWAQKYAEATTSITNRAETIAHVAEELERGLVLLGATAIEDRLQDGVPETIENLRRANIRVWMLTGDKTETAINIGRTCNLIKKDSHIMVLNDESCKIKGRSSSTADDVALIRTWIDSSIDQFMSLKRVSPKSPILRNSHVLVVVEGRLLSRLEKHAGATDNAQDATTEKLLDLLIACDNVICCRFSPAQKALLVRAVKNRLSKQHSLPGGSSPLLTELQGGGPSTWKRVLDTLLLRPRQSGVTLGVGDGANDIPMLLSAHVGIGITGREGLAASRASDYSIAKFRFLQPLLFVHGRWSYQRISLFVLGTLYKNFCFYGTQAVFQFWCGFSGTSLFEQWTLASNNVLFTSLPVMVVGMFEKDLNRSTLLAVPELYRYGQENKAFNFRIQIRWLLQGMFHAIISVLIPAIFYGGFYRSTPGGSLTTPLFFSANTTSWFQQTLLSDGSGEYQETALYPFGTVSYTATVLFCTIKVLYIESHNITFVHHAVGALTFIVWVLWQFIYSYIWAPKGFFGADTGYEYSGLYFTIVHTQLRFWMVVILTVVIGLVCEDIGLKFFELLSQLVRHGFWGGRQDSAVVDVGGQGGMPVDEYELASQKARIAAKNAMGEHNWANDVSWWQFWEKQHGVRSSLAKDAAQA